MNKYYTNEEIRYILTNYQKMTYKKRIDVIKSKGYNTVIIWGYDWNNFKEIVKNQITAVLSGNGQDYDSAKSVKAEKSQNEVLACANTEVTEDTKETSEP